MKKRIFKKIFTKHLHRGKTPLTELAQDVGKLHGIVTIHGIDMNGKTICHEQYKNIVVNQSKSAIIRLLGQNTSIYSGAIVPTDFKIDRMRFSNDTGSGVNGLVGPHRLEYYNLAEASHRVSFSSVYGGIYFGGGLKGQTTCSPPTNPSEESYKHDISKEFSNIAGITGYQAATNAKIFDLRSNVNPPSHASVVIKIYKDFNDGSGSQLIEQINLATDGEGGEVIYNRDAFSNYPLEIINFKITSQGGKFFHVSTPFADGVVYTDYASHPTYGACRITKVEETGTNTTNTRVFYDYTSGQTGWKFLLEETQATDADVAGWSGYNPAITKVSAGDNPSSSNNVWDKIKLTYTLGQYNIVNLVIPKVGYNNGYGYTDLLRYNNQNGDYYETVTPTYQDCGDDFIDDYAVTFTTSMNANYGNGSGGKGDDAIKYTKGFLFCKNNLMFSSIIFTQDNFVKNSNNSFQISWKILAPVE